MSHWDNPDYWKVIRYCQRWGVPVIPTTSFKPANREPIPIKEAFPLPNNSENYKYSVIKYVERGRICPLLLEHETAGKKKPHLTPNELLHDLAHAVCPGDPDSQDEIDDGILAFEWYSQRRLRLGNFKEWMSEFQIGMHQDSKGEWNQYDWASANPSMKRKVVSQSLIPLVKLRIMTDDGRPTFDLYRIRE